MGSLTWRRAGFGLREALARLPAGQRSRLLALSLSASILCGCGAAAPISGIPVTGPTSLLELFPQARKATASGADLADYVKLAETRIEEKPEQVLFLHPPSNITLALRLERPGILDTAIAIDPQGWTKGGDGVTFYVAVREQGEDLPTYLFSRHLYPQLVEAHRGWQPVQLDLSPYRQRDFELILGTYPGPEFDPGYDWAVWREPLLYHPVLDSEWAAARRGKRAGNPQ